VHIKGVYTSDIQYTATSLPKQIGFKIGTGKDWFAEYCWINIPNVELDHTSKTENTNNNKTSLKQTKAQ